jgi:tape measure domain-containing protein
MAKNAAIEVARIKELPQRPAQPMLRAQRIAGLLPPVPGRYSGSGARNYGQKGYREGLKFEPREAESRSQMTARRTAEAYARSAFRSMDVMGGGAGRPASPYSYAYRGARSREAIVPYTNPGNGAIVPTGPRARGGTAAPAGRTGDRGTGGLSVPNLPGAGIIQELGSEFGFAAKQVLLFGTAYKALAFLTGFPQQVMDAVSSLQSFRNTLNAISPTAEEAAASNQFILDTVAKYNIPLVSARDGFTKLYASMKPAGFKTEQINNLYLGISKASATLGLSSDKVDRVTYAFSQMASKGQLMAEEVTGQLGDVIPGALSIMAEAAQMDIKTFKKAMEDGAFTGKAFEAVMSNVPIVLEKRFGKGAEGAAKTFQGAMNNMQTSLVLFYQSFEPVAVGFLNSVVTPMTAGIKTVTDGFNAFFSGQAAQTAQGSAFAKQLSELRPTFDGITANIKALVPSFQLFGGVLLNAAKVLAMIAGNPITGFLAKVYVNALLVNAAFSLLGGKILIGLITNISASIGRFIALNIAMVSLQRTTAVTNSTLAGTQLQMQLLNRNAVLPLITSLARLATFAAIAIAVTVTISGREELNEVQRQIDKLKKEKNPVGPAGPVPIPTAARNYTGATREKVKADQQKQIDFIAKLRKDLKGLEDAFALGVAPEIATKKMELLRLQIAKAAEVIDLDPKKFKTAAQQQAAAASSSMAPIPSGAGDTGKQGATLLNAIEQREEAIADAREQREESIASIRKNAAEEFMRMEQALADRRIKIEREIIAVKQKSTDTLEDIQRQTRIAQGEDADIVGDEQKVADIKRKERDTNLEITQRIADEEKEQARNIADFQKKVAKDIQGANEAHAKRIGEIQQGYARQVAKIIADGTGKAAKRLTTAAELAAVYIQRSYSFSPVTGSSFPMPVEAKGTTPIYEEGTTVPRSIELLDQKRLDLEQKLIKQLTSSKSPGIGEQFTALLGAEGGFEDIAGLEPLPWLKMLKQMGRPLTKIYQQIENSSQTPWAYSRRDRKKMLAPEPKRSQAILDKAGKFEAVKQDWNPLEAELRQKFNQINSNPRSKPGQASLATFEGVVRDVSKSLFNKLNKMPGIIYGILGDVSDYLEEGQKEVLRKGITEQLQQGVDPSRMPIGGSEYNGMHNLKQAVKDITAEVLRNEKITPRGAASTRPLAPLNGDSEWIQRFMEQPSIVPGVQNRIEGASLPGAGFDVSKVATDFGTIAAASILRGVLDASRILNAPRGTQIAQSYRVGDQVGYDQPRTPESIRTTGSTQRLQSGVQAASAAEADAGLRLVFSQIVEDSVKASGELAKQIDLIKKQAAAIRGGINSELADEFVQLDANYEKELARIKARKLSVIEEKKLVDQAKELRDALKAQTEERLLQSKILEGTIAVDKLKEEIKLLRVIGDDERRLAELRKQYGAEEGQKIFDLQIIKENIEATRALIGDFVSSATGDYKGFLKAVISGEDAADALKQFQDGLKDKVLTIFLDFAMAPVEKFLKEGLEGLLLPKSVKQKAGELPKEIAKDPVEATNRNTDVTALNTVALESVAAALAGASSTPGGVVGSPEEKTKDELDKMAKDTGKPADDAKDNGEKFKESLGKVTAGIGIAAGSIMGIMAGMNQIKKGGTGNTLMGIGSILASVGGGIGGFMKLAGANGGTATGGWKPFPARAFANGGMVKGPTLGLVGEGKYNEAIVPLPDGRSIPVQMRGGPGGGSSRDLLSTQAQSRSSPSVLSMSFQSTTINGVEYVDRAQLEMAMAETRRVASRDGAARGANLAIDRLANSPSSRRRAGIR